MMFSRIFKRFFIISIIISFAMGAMAQQGHFIYLQTDNGQPFYVKMNNKLVSSSQAGYVILPSLAEGQLELVLGFPKNEFPEEKFNLLIEDKNEGYLIKNLGDKGWSLFNLQTLALINSNTKPPSTEVVTKKIENDPFSTMLANVVQDSSLLVSVVPVVEKPVEVVTPQPVTDTNSQQSLNVVSDQPTVIVTDKTTDTPAITGTVITTTQPKASIIVTDTPKEPVVQTTVATAGIKRTLLLREKTGLQLVYVDKGITNNDTIRIFMPASVPQNNNGAQIIVTEKESPIVSKSTESQQLTITPTIVTSMDMVDTASHQNTDTATIKIPVIEKEANNEKEAQIKYEEPLQDATQEARHEIKKDSEIIVLPKVVTSSTVNSDCKNFANDADFLLLRKMMASQNNNEDMIQVAKKEFRTKCFSTEQIKNLSYLFLNDQGKYRFFDAAYAYASDSNLYETLQNQFADEYYLNRFKAMIHK